MNSRVAKLMAEAGYRPRGIVHVGAHAGQEMPHYLALEPALIVWVEADPALLPRLRGAVEAAASPISQLVVNALIADTDGQARAFHRFSNHGQSSSLFRATRALQDRWPDVSETGEVLQLVSARLDTVLRAQGVAPADVDVLVLDMQGAELMALAGAGDYLGGAEFVEVEASQEEIYQGAPLADAIEAAMADAGFERLTRIRWHGAVVFRRRAGAS